VIRPEFSCRPCSDYCIFDQPYCLRAISTDEVYDAVESQMNRIGKSGKELNRSSTLVAHWSGTERVPAAAQKGMAHESDV
jgi:hypothetical protein